MVGAIIPNKLLLGVVVVVVVDIDGRETCGDGADFSISIKLGFVGATAGMVVGAA